MAANGYHWWRQRLRAHFEFFDLVRIDHFRGLVAAWTIPADEPTAINGYWVDAPGVALLTALAAECGGLPLVAEDLGVITPDVVALRRQFGLPGMSVLQFAFDNFEDNPHKPENVEENAVYYTGTHDNDTLVGWWSQQDDGQRHTVMTRLGCDAAGVPQAMLDTVFASRAELAVVPMQDLLGLGSEARMNTPGTAQDNWDWRMAPDALSTDLALSLQQQLIKTARCHP
jgi:4-alpha-glucanotransferase